jgi:hypothetical protein
MKRKALKLLLFLLLGAIINVAVAWGCAYWTLDLKAGARQGEAMSLHANRWWKVKCWTRSTSTLVWWFVMPFEGERAVEEPSPRSIIPWWSTLPRSTEHISDAELGSPRAHRPRRFDHYQAAWGVPLRTFMLECKSDPIGITLIGGLRVNDESPMYSPRIVPYHPIWPGFAINTIFYAALAWALFAVPGYIKRRRRIKRGVCVRCAYPVGSNDKCTECGAVVKKGSLQ